jgi:hypothetical protein
MERMTAKKVTISELSGGQWNRMEGFEPSFILTASGEKVSRARVLATVVAKFVSEDGNFASITLDDSTDTIRAKAFKEVRILEAPMVGEMVDVIAKVREYNGEVYLMPEVVRKVSDPNEETLRRMELLGRPAQAGAGPQLQEAGAGPGKDMAEVRKELLGIMESHKGGIPYSELVEKSSHPENVVEAAVNELLAEGVCYEPTPGKIKKI